MKNVPHPSWVPADAPEAVGAIAGEAPVVTDADVGGIAATPAPANPWANPISAFNRTISASTDEKKPKHATRADEAVAFLRTHGPTAPRELAKAMDITSKGGVSPFIQSALKDQRIVRVDGKYALPGAEASTEKSCEPQTVVKAAAPSVSEAAAAIAAMRQPSAKATAAEPKPAELAPAAISHFEAATAIVAKRKPRAAPPTPPEVPAAAATEPTKAAGRKPEFVVFADDIQFLSWPNGDITLQTEACSVDLGPQHFRALMALAEMRK